MTHLIDDKTVAKMGHPMVVVRSNVGHPSKHRESYADYELSREVQLIEEVLVSSFCVVN
jgi:hypothetical protein